MPKRRSGKRGYHHGNLESALIDAGLEIVATQGIEALSLRAVARRANVSHAAPYYHFAGKAELLAAVAAASFDRMVRLIHDLAARAGAASPLDRLRAVGLGYMRFALGAPWAFRLMFRPELTRPAEHPRLMQAEARAFGTLMEAIMECQRQGVVSGVDPRPPAAFAWSGVHGLAMLHIDGVLAETPLGEMPVQQLAAQINEAIIDGLVSRRWC